MKLYIRLQQLLQDSGLKVADIVRENPGLTEYRVRHLMDDTAREISREVLEKVCSFLVNHNIVDRSDLPDILFARSPERFWHLLNERLRVTLCMGTRPDKDYQDHVVVAADSMLQANLLKRMTEAALVATTGNSSQPVKGRQKVVAAQVIDPRLVRTWKQNIDTLWDAKVRSEADEFYDEFLRQPEKNSALVCFGSIKSNPVIEKVVVKSFLNSIAFASQDDCDDARRRSCPFLLTYRPRDPQPASVCGGKRLFKQASAAEPGIFYECSDGSWDRAAWSRTTQTNDHGQEIEKGEDAALVYYRFEKKTPRLELVMGGYSGRGTRCLAECVRNDQFDIDRFWPPTISNDQLDVAVFVVKFHVEGSKHDFGGAPSMYESMQEPVVIRLAKEALEHRLAPAA